MTDEEPEGLDNPIAKWTVIVTMVALVLVLAVSTWLAFSVSLDGYTRVDPGTDRIHIRGV